MKHAHPSSASGHSAHAITLSIAKLLADTYVLNIKTQNYHWNVVAPDFRPLHAFFEEMYNALTPNIDLLAERIRSLGKYAPGSMKEMLKFASLKEEVGGPASAQAMLTNLLADHQQMITQCKQVIEAAQKQHDPGTADLVTTQLQLHEKFVWMLSASLLNGQHNVLEDAA